MAEQEPQNQEASPTRINRLTKVVINYFVPMCLFVISLGSFSEAFILVNDFSDMLKTKFSNSVEYETLDSIKVGNTAAYIEDMIGAPRVIKPVGEDLEANYYFNDKYLLAIFYQKERVTAYTVVSLVDSLKPELPWDSSKNLADDAFARFASVPDDHLVDVGSTNNVYIETIDTGVHGMFLNAYLGSIKYGSGDFDDARLTTLNRNALQGDDEALFSSLAAYREIAQPNFYGQGDLTIDQLHLSLLTPAELSGYFDFQ